VTTTMRLDRLLANMGYGSRRDVQDLVRYGAVMLDGAALSKADARIAVTPDLSQRMTVEGKPLDPPPGLILMLHKPLGVTCSHKEAGGLVYDLLPDRWRRRDPAISTIGRLDKETSGLLLLTDDGALLHRITAPRSRIAKIYEATLARPLTGEEAAIFAAGTLMLRSETTPLAPAALEAIGEQRARLTIVEGRYHQVKRMFAAVGNHVEALHRAALGGLTLGELQPGQWRFLAPDETARVFDPPERAL
jgi:16S rRNA pseudouridine516 synthase